jgi:hypothetical protein
MKSSYERIEIGVGDRIERAGVALCVSINAAPLIGRQSEDIGADAAPRLRAALAIALFLQIPRGRARVHEHVDGGLRSRDHGREEGKGLCHVWMAPADQGLFFGVALVVGAVMSSACDAEN